MKSLRLPPGQVPETLDRLLDRHNRSDVARRAGISRRMLSPSRIASLSLETQVRVLECMGYTVEIVLTKDETDDD